jgi:transcriptional regulator with XRE-family HTH domain
LLDIAAKCASLQAVRRVREPFYEALGRQIALLRQRLGMSQQTLGALMQPQMKRASIANIETGQQRVLAHTLVQLAAALNCDLDTLAGSPHEAVQPEGEAVQRELEGLVKDEEVPREVVDILARSLGLVSRRKGL